MEAFEAYGGIPDPSQLPQPLSQMYLRFPLTHLDVIAVKLTTAVQYKAAMFLAVSVPLVLSTTFVFLAARQFGHEKAGLMAMLLLNMSDYHIDRSVQPIPTSLGIALVTIIVYLLFRKGGRHAPFVLLTLLLMLALVLTHSISAFVLFTIMFFFLCGVYIYRMLSHQRASPDTTMFNPYFVAVFAVLLIGYWMYYAYLSQVWTFFDIMIDGLYSQYTQSGYGTYGKPISGLGNIVNFLGFLVLLLFAIWGVLLWCSKQHWSQGKMAWVCAVVAMVGVPFGSSAMGITLIVPSRWIAFGFVLLSVPAAFGMVSFVTSRFSARWIQSAVVVVAVLAISFLMITNKVANLDSPVYTPALDQRLVYTNSEMALGKRATELFDGTIVTDAQFGWTVVKVTNKRLWDTYYDIPSWIVDPAKAGYDIGKQRNRPPEDNSEIPDAVRNDDVSWRSGLVLWRGIMMTQGVQAPRWVAPLGEDLRQELEVSHDRVYDNGSNQAYLAQGRLVHGN